MTTPVLWYLSDFIEDLRLQQKSLSLEPDTICPFPVLSVFEQIEKWHELTTRNGKKDHFLCMLELDYTDEYYTDEYYTFYSHRFNSPKKTCCRLHLFYFPKGVPHKVIPINVLKSAEKSAPEASLSCTYFGNFVFRPWVVLSKGPGNTQGLAFPKPGNSISYSIWHPISEAHIKQNATSLATPLLATQLRRTVHFMGHCFEVTGVPFAQQDSSVGACAQASIWVTDRIMHSHFGTTKRLTSNITSLAKSSSPGGRIIPAQWSTTNGLTFEQMCTALVKMDMHPLCYYIDDEYHKIDNLAHQEFNPVIKSASADRLWTAVLSYVGSGLPAILVGSKIKRGSIAQDLAPPISSAVPNTGPSLDNYNEPAGNGPASLPDLEDYDQDHAITAVGYMSGHTSDRRSFFLKECKSFLIHDDQLGPYLISDLQSSFSLLLNLSDESDFWLRGILVPQPGKIYLTALDASTAAEQLWCPLIAGSLKRGKATPKVKVQCNYDEMRDYFFRLRVLRSMEYLDRLTRRPSGRKSMPSEIREMISGIKFPRYVWICELLKWTKRGPTSNYVVGTVILDATADKDACYLFMHYGRKYCDYIGRKSGDDIKYKPYDSYLFQPISCDLSTYASSTKVH